MRLALQISSIAALAALACDAGPVVQLGRLPNKAPDASTAGRGDDPETHECTEFDPVCGANGVTYMNTCKALLAGTSVAAHGACPQ